MFARFICATILHLSLVDEVSHGLEMMKFSSNHPYKFNSFIIAWISGFLQTVSCLSVEIANIGVLCGADDTISIVFNFIALAIIAEFDNFVFASMKNETMRDLIEKPFTRQCLMYSHTTSKKAGTAELSDQKDDYGDFRPLRVSFGDRTCSNKLAYAVYKLMRTFYVAFFYYFIPFVAIVMSTLVPLQARNIYNKLPYCAGLQ